MRKTGTTTRMLRLLWYIPAVLWMVVIFRMSAQSGAQSGSLSLRVTEEVVDVIEEVRGGDVADRERLVALLHAPVRKAAHMAEYAALALFLMLAFSANMRGIPAIAWSMPATFLYACSDELHQRFVSERAGQFEDVAIDMLGASAMVFLALMALGIYERLRERRGTGSDRTP